MDEEIDTHRARSIVQIWMSQHNYTAADLARASNLDRAVIHRFLQHARPMRLRTAVHIYAAVQAHMDEATRTELRTALGLQEIMQLLIQTEQTSAADARTYSSGPARAISQIAYAVHLCQLGFYGKAADIFEQTTHVLQSSKSLRELAMYSACEHIRCLIELGCFNTARDEIANTASRFGRNCGTEGMLRLLALRLRLIYEHGDISNASFLFRKLMFEADLHQHAAYRSEALHYGALLRLALAMRTAEPKRREIQIGKAMRLFRMHEDYENRHTSNPITAGMRALRWAEIHRIRCADEDARAARRVARSMLRNTSAIHAVYTEMAKVFLDRDQLDRSRSFALEARSIAVEADLAVGVVHASYVLAISDIMEEKFSSALDHAIIAAALAPSWCYEDGTSTLEFMRHTLRSLIASLEPAQRSRFELDLHDRIGERRGLFAVLDSLRAARNRARLHIYGQVSI